MNTGFVVIGAGNGGQSLAGDMVLRKVPVNAIYDINNSVIGDIKRCGGIRMSGPVVEGFAPLTFPTSDLKEAMNAGDTFLVCITSLAYNSFAKQLAPFVKPNHTFLLMPGYVGTSMMFLKILEDYGVKKLPLVGEAFSFPYATRLVEPAHAGIKARKKCLHIAALPATRNEELLHKIKPAINEVVIGTDVLSVGFNNVNPTTHIVPYLLNLDKVEMPSSGDFDFHVWGTQTVQRIKYELDYERCRVMRAIGLTPVTYNEFMEICYRNEHYKPIPQKFSSELPNSASQVPDRFIDEDVPMGIVPMSCFGELAGVKTPVIDLMINLAQLVRERDFRKEGTNLSKMGLEGFSIEGIYSYAMTGKIGSRG